MGVVADDGRADARDRRLEGLADRNDLDREAPVEPRKERETIRLDAEMLQ